MLLLALPYKQKIVHLSPTLDTKFSISPLFLFSVFIDIKIKQKKHRFTSVYLSVCFSFDLMDHEYEMINLLWSTVHCTEATRWKKWLILSGEKCAMDKIQEKSEDYREEKQWVRLLSKPLYTRAARVLHFSAFIVPVP